MFSPCSYTRLTSAHFPASYSPSQRWWSRKLLPKRLLGHGFLVVEVIVLSCQCHTGVWLSLLFSVPNFNFFSPPLNLQPCHQLGEDHLLIPRHFFLFPHRHALVYQIKLWRSASSHVLQLGVPEGPAIEDY